MKLARFQRDGQIDTGIVEGDTITPLGQPDMIALIESGLETIRERGQQAHRQRPQQ